MHRYLLNSVFLKYRQQLLEVLSKKLYSLEHDLLSEKKAFLGAKL